MKLALKILLSLTLLLIVALLLLTAYSLSIQNQERLEVKPHNGVFVSAYDTEIFVQSAGKQDAPAIVFVHGTGAWSEIWRASMDSVASLGFQSRSLG